jgi:hypothetical protein
MGIKGIKWSLHKHLRNKMALSNRWEWYGTKLAVPVGHFLSLTFSPSRTRKSLEVIFIFILHSWFDAFRALDSASKPAITSNSSSSMLFWRKRWNVPLRFSSNSSMFLSARCIAARRQMLIEPYIQDTAAHRDDRAKVRGTGFVLHVCSRLYTVSLIARG